MQVFGEKIRVGMYDSNEQINHNSWTIGGTHITNFSIDQLMKYKNTIEDYKKIKPEENFIISGFAYSRDGNPISDYSLHCISEFGNLDKFWRILEGH